MNKGLFTFIFSLVLLITSAGCMGAKPQVAQPAKTQTAVIQEIGTSSAALVTRSKDKVFVYCTAVWVGKTTLVTAHHCVKAAADRWAEENEQDELEDLKGFKIYYTVKDEVSGVGKEPTGMHLATATMLDPKHDLAVLKAEGEVVPPHTVATLATTMPEIGEHVFVLGHVTGLYWTHVEGVVSAYRTSLPFRGIPGGPFVQISGPVYYGNSGGGAFNTKGELVGIASFMTRAPQTTMFIHVDSVRNLFEKPSK